MIFSSLTPHCNLSKSSCRLAGERLLLLLRERLEDLAILRQLKARYQLQVCSPQPARSTIQTTCAFSGQLFLINHLLHAFSAVLRTLLHSPSGASHPRFSCSKCNTPLKACSSYYLQLQYLFSVLCITTQFLVTYSLTFHFIFLFLFDICLFSSSILYI